MPLLRFESTLDSIRPNLVLLTAQQLHTAASLLDITEFLQKQEVQVELLRVQQVDLLELLKEEIPLQETQVAQQEQLLQVEFLKARLQEKKV